MPLNIEYLRIMRIAVLSTDTAAGHWHRKKTASHAVKVYGSNNGKELDFIGTSFGAQA